METPIPVNPESELLVKFNLAQDIIRELFEAKATGKIQVLLMQCTLSAKQLDPESYRKFIVHANSILAWKADSVREGG